MRMQASVQKHKLVGKAVEKKQVQWQQSETISEKIRLLEQLFLFIFSKQFQALLPVDKHTGSLGLQVWRCPVVESGEEYKII